MKYIEMRKRRCFNAWELEPIEIRGVVRSARADQIHWTRRDLAELESRLRVVVNSLPQRAGYAADQDYFELRSDRYDLPWYVNCKFASYVSLTERLNVYKEIRAIERRHEERRREEEENAMRAEAYPELIRRIRDLEERVIIQAASA